MFKMAVDMSAYSGMHIISNDVSCGSISVNVLSYNMHGYNQGSIAVRDTILASEPDIVLLQEHWLTPTNLHRFQDDFPSYFSFGASAMNIAVETGILRGRPYGGVMTLVKQFITPNANSVCK